MPTERQLANLRPLGPDQDREAARRNGAAGGIKSGESKRRKKRLREAAQWMLQQDDVMSCEEVKARLAEMGVDNPTNAEGLVLAAFMKAYKGDVDAMRFIRDTAGEAPSNRVELSGDLERPIAALDLRTLSEAELLRLAEVHAEDDGERE